MALDAFPDGRSPPAFMLQGINDDLFESFLANQAFAPPVMSGNGRLIADQTEAAVQIVDVSHGHSPTEVALIEPDLDVSASLALNGDGSLLAAPSSGGTIELWDIARGEKVQTLPAPNGESQYWQLEFSPSAGVVAALGGEAAFGETAHIDLWDVASNEFITLDPINSLDVLTFDISSTNLLAAASSDSSVHLFDLNNRTELLPLPVESVGSIMFDEAGSRLAVMTFDRVDVYAVPTGELLGSVFLPADDFGRLLGFRSADTLLMHVSRVSEIVDSGASDPFDSCRLQEWTVTGELLGDVELDCRSQPVALSDDGERLLAMGDEGWSVWLTADGSTLVNGVDPKGTVSVGGSVVARTDSDGRVAVRLVDGGEGFTTLPGAGFQQVVVDGDGDTLIASTADQLSVIDVQTGDVQSTTTLPWQPALLATSDDGQVVAVASSEGQLLRWDARGNKEPVGLRHTGEIKSLAVTGSGRGVAVASADAITTYTDSGTTTTPVETQVIEVATDPIGDALAAVVERPPSDSPETARPALPSEEAQPSDGTDLLLWGDVDEKPRRIELRSGRPTALAVTREHVVIASEQGIDVYGRRNLQLAGGFKVGDFFVESPLTVAVAVSDTEHPTVASIAADGTTGFRFHLDAEGIRDDLDAAASNNSWEDLNDEECRQFASIGCL
jgi:WD40 repeat protein